jgi:molybdopterin-guanine dinucleotide biosynthesis protein A
MVAEVLARLQPQVEEIIINANREIERYAQFGYTVMPDTIAGYAGPLAGLHAGMTQARHDLVATVPCDSPFLPHDLVSRLKQALLAEAAQIAYARTGDQLQPVFCLCHKALLPDLSEYLTGGGRKVEHWFARHRAIAVAFDDVPQAFLNINTPEELSCLE